MVDNRAACEAAWEAPYGKTTRRLADKRVTSMLYMALGKEAQKKVEQKLTDFRLNDYILATFRREVTEIFTQARIVTIERLALFSRQQKLTKHYETSTRHSLTWLQDATSEIELTP